MKKIACEPSRPSSCETEDLVDAVLASISASMRERWSAPASAQSPNYDVWRAKSNLTRLIDGDTNEAWEAKLRGEGEVGEKPMGRKGN